MQSTAGVCILHVFKAYKTLDDFPLGLHHPPNTTHFASSVQSYTPPEQCPCNSNFVQKSNMHRPHTPTYR